MSLHVSAAWSVLAGANGGMNYNNPQSAPFTISPPLLAHQRLQKIVIDMQNDIWSHI